MRIRRTSWLRNSCVIAIIAALLLSYSIYLVPIHHHHFLYATHRHLVSSSLGAYLIISVDPLARDAHRYEVARVSDDSERSLGLLVSHIFLARLQAIPVMPRAAPGAWLSVRRSVDPSRFIPLTLREPPQMLDRVI